MDDFVVRLEKQVWAIWLPVIASAALALGFVLGTWFANVRQGTPEGSSTAQSQQTPMPEAPAQQVVPQRTQSIIETKPGLGAAGLRILRRLLRKLRKIWMDSLTDMVRGQPASNNIFGICLTNTNF
jgi:hypothetical protein